MDYYLLGERIGILAKDIFLFLLGVWFARKMWKKFTNNSNKKGKKKK